MKAVARVFAAVLFCGFVGGFVGLMVFVAREYLDDHARVVESERLDAVTTAMTDCTVLQGVWTVNYSHEGDTTTYSCMVNTSVFAE